MAVWSRVSTADMTSDARWDAEYYQPAFLEQAERMAKRPTTPLSKVAMVSDGNHVSIAEDFCDEGVRYLRGQDLSDFFISDGDPLYIPPKQYVALKRSHMHPGDVLVGIVGTIGSVGLVTDRHGDLTGNCKLAIVRCRDLPAEYVAAYLASRVGQNEIRRRVRGSVQMGLILPDLRDIPIILPTDAHKNAVVDSIRGAELARKEAQNAIASAEDLLLTALKLSDLDLSPTTHYARPMRDLVAGNRFGAEYYMPCKQRVLSALSAIPHKPLAYHLTSFREMWNPEDARRGEIVRNFDLGHALDCFLDDSVEPTTARDVGSSKKTFERGDIVVSRLRSYLREIAVVRTSSAVPCVGSSEFIVLRPAGTELSVEAALVYLRCPIVQTILRWSQDGSNHPRFDEADLLAVPVPDALLAVQASIREHVHASIIARQNATRLLTEATAMVERSTLLG